MAMKFRFHNAGFSMVELLVVIAIITLIMAMVMPKAGNLIENGRENQCRNNLKQLHTAAMSALQDDGSGKLPAPTSIEQWVFKDSRFYHIRGWVTAANSSLNNQSLINTWPSKDSKSADLYDDQGVGSIAKFAVEYGSLFKYMNKSFKHYVCPVMKSKKEDSRAGSDEQFRMYRTYAMVGGSATRSDERDEYLPDGGEKARINFKDQRNSSRTLLFAEIVPSKGSNTRENRTAIQRIVSGSRVTFKTTKAVGTKQSDSMLWPISKDAQNEEYIAYDVDNNELSGRDKYGIHSAPNKTKASLAVFMDGHIEKIYSLTPNNSYNMAWYLVNGKDPSLDQ